MADQHVLEVHRSMADTTAVRPDEMRVRPMRDEERPAVGRVMRSAFPPTEWVFFSCTEDTLVAERDGRIVGGAVLDTYPLPGGRTGGFIVWLFVAPEAQGLGIGQRLTEAALDLFEARGCDEVAACVEGYNTSSSKLFATRGFGILSPGEQLRRYGLTTPVVWWRMNHIFDIGHFVWARPCGVSTPHPAWQWAAAAVLGAAVQGLALWRQTGFGRVGAATWAAMLTVPVVFGLRHLGMWLAARRQGIRTEYRMWESGVGLGLLLGLAFGQWYPAPGSLYPAGDRWTYREVLPRLAPVALAGALPMVVLAWVAWWAAGWAGLPPALAPWALGLRWVAGSMALFDTVMAFFPFVSLNGRRLWDWNRWVWLAVAAPAAALQFV